jgi:hypothetical protein
MEAERFLDLYTRALEQGDAAVFVGAGLSRPSGYVDWRGLLREIARDLGLDVDRETDLIAVAQYHVNTEGGRARLDQLIMEEFTKDTKPSGVHNLLARLPVKTVWTTNYDKLIEEAYRSLGKRVDVKTVSGKIAVTLPRRDVVLYKMHGDVEDPGNAVLTKEDYETYQHGRQAFSTTLEADLLTKTFLFLGFSFTDPNLDYVLARIRGLLGAHQREHFCILRPPRADDASKGAARAEKEYERRKFELRVADLLRYSIKTVLVDEYADVPDLLAELDRRVRIRSIFVSGSAAEYGAFGKTRLEEFLRQLGFAIVTNRFRLISGLGLGVGNPVLLGAMEALYQPRELELGETEDRLAVRPFPIGIQDPERRRSIWSQHRRLMIQEAGVAIFVSGNRLENNEIIEAPGVHEEFEIASEFDIVPIPVGATGYAARTLWEKIVSDPEPHFGELNVIKELTILGNPQESNEKLVRAVIDIIRKLG